MNKVMKILVCTLCIPSFVYSMENKRCIPQKQHDKTLVKNSEHNLTIGPYFSNGENVSRKVVIKTHPAHWRNTMSPVLIPFSIHSRIYDGIEGTFKIAALLHLIKSLVKGEITVLLTEGAHLNALSLKYDGDLNKALDICMQDANNLKLRFEHELDNCHIARWTDFVYDDSDYSIFKNTLLDLYDNDNTYKSLITADIESTYTIDRQNEYQNKQHYFDACKLDLIETTIALLLIASKKGYRFQFYPGKTYLSMAYINNQLLKEDERLNWVNMRISVKDKC
jgi:hypothetical protein